MKNVRKKVRNYGVRQKDQYHVPGFKPRINVRYNGIIVWNTMLSSGVAIDASQAVFFSKKNLKFAIIEGTLWRFIFLEYWLLIMLIQ